METNLTLLESEEKVGEMYNQIINILNESDISATQTIGLIEMVKYSSVSSFAGKA